MSFHCLSESKSFTIFRIPRSLDDIDFIYSAVPCLSDFLFLSLLILDYIDSYNFPGEFSVCFSMFLSLLYIYMCLRVLALKCVCVLYRSVHEFICVKASIDPTTFHYPLSIGRNRLQLQNLRLNPWHVLGRSCPWSVLDKNILWMK